MVWQLASKTRGAPKQGSGFDSSTFRHLLRLHQHRIGCRYPVFFYVDRDDGAGIGYRTIVRLSCQTRTLNIPPPANSSLWTRENIAWLAGLFEGEGCISITKVKRSDQFTRFNLVINMTDEDVLFKAHKIAGMGNITKPRFEKIGGKPLRRFSIWGNRKCMALAWAMYPFLCERRQAKIRAMVEEFKLDPPTPRPRGISVAIARRQVAASAPA